MAGAVESDLLIAKSPHPSPARAALAWAPWAVLYLATFVVFLVASLSSHDAFWPRQVWGEADGTSEYCEPLHADSGVMEPVNAWSNFATYGLLGTVVCALGTADALRLRNADAGFFGERLRDSPMLSLLCGLSWLLLGVGSFFFHASHVEAWHVMDVGFTMAAVACMAGVSLVQLLLLHRAESASRRAWLTIGTSALVVLLDAVLIANQRSLNHTAVLVGLAGMLVVLEGLVQPLLHGKSREQWAFSSAAMLALLFGWCMRTLETSWGRPLCVHSSWFQPHSIWHATTALAIALQVHAWRLPFPATASRAELPPVCRYAK